MAFDIDPELNAMLAKLPNPQLRIISPGLERIEALLAALGNPHHHLPPVIHIAGTNGKGSTLAFLRAMLEAAGKRVHVYTSPHLVSFCERIVLAGAPITKAQLMPILKRVHALHDECPSTFFEATTAAAFVAFAENEADVVLLETGLGGRLDATNVIAKPLANIITPIGLDHQEFLGDTLAQIAAEKAGILRAGVPAFIAPQQPEVMEVLRQYEAEFHLCDGRLEAGLPSPNLEGAHQISNAALAVQCVRHCFPEITTQQIATGITSAYWPARLQRLNWSEVSVPVYLDGAHNAMGGAALAAWASKLPQKPVLVLAMKADKDAAAFIEKWRGVAAKIYAVPIPGETEYVAPQRLYEIAQSFDIPCEIAEEAFTAIAVAASMKQPVIICGSLYLAGAILAKS